MSNKISTRILEDLGFIMGIIILIFGITTKDMSIGWYFGCLASGSFLISLFRRNA